MPRQPIDRGNRRANELRIFVSSSVEDLGVYREILDATLRRGGHQPVMMEYFGAIPRKACKECLDLARSCDALVVVVAHRYGWIPTAQDGGDGYKSITRLETEVALAAGVPIFAYVVDNAHPWTLSKEQDRITGAVDDLAEVERIRTSVKGLLEFKSFIKNEANIITDSFTTPENLATRVALALSRWKHSAARAGVSTSVLQTSNLPSTGKRFYGRESDIKALEAAWTEQRINVVSVIAWGGVGKSSLINNWLQAMLKRSFSGARNIYTWSFYTQGNSDRRTSGELFINAALQEFGDPEPQVGSPEQKGHRLAKLVRKKRTLLILDGLEPLQYPPGENEEGRIREPSLRTLVRELAAENPGLLVIASRFRLTDLDEYGSTAKVLMLGRVSLKAGVQILRDLGVKGTPKELRAAVNEYDGHCLSLSLLGSYLHDACEGDIRRRNDLKRFSEGGPEYRHVTRVLGAYQGYLAERGLRSIRLLELVGLFDRPAAYAELEAVQAPPPIGGLTDDMPFVDSRDWRKIVAPLRRAGLLLPGSADRALDAHPLIRAYFSKTLETRAQDAFREANRRLYKHLTGTVKELPTTLEEMTPLFAAVMHGCTAGNHQEVFDNVFMARILQGERGFSVFELGAFEATLSTLSNFFDEPWTQPARGLSEGSRAFVLSRAGYFLTKVGRLNDAVRPLELGLDLARGLKDWPLAEKSARHLSGHFRMIGQLKRALEYAEEDARVAKLANDPFVEASGRTTLGQLLHQLGRSQDAMQEFDRAEKSQKRRDPNNPILYSYPGYRYCDLLLSLRRYKEVADRARRNLARSSRRYSLYDLARDTFTLGQALAGLAAAPRTKQWNEACSKLDEGVNLLRRTGDHELYVAGLTRRAALHIHSRDYAKAREDLREALGIATRDSMRLHEADCCIWLTHLYLGRGDKRAALELFSKAKKLVEETGYSRRKPELNVLGKML